MLSWHDLAARVADCPICGKSVLVKLGDHSTAVRCVRCGGSAIHMSLAWALNCTVTDLGTKDVYEMSSRGPIFEYLKSRCRTLTFSEYYDDTLPGSYSGDVQCQDVQYLTYPDASFDLCTSTEVFEHVPNDCQGFREICRVLRPGGITLFTVPITEAVATVERAWISDGKIEYILEPAYHGDRIRGQGGVLCFRDYGPDIVSRVQDQGFSEAMLIEPDDSGWWNLGCRVVCAKK